MTQQPSWTRFSLHLAEFVVFAAGLAVLQFVRRGPLEGEPFFWLGMLTTALGVALLGGLGHAALGMTKARSTDLDKHQDDDSYHTVHLPL